MSIGLVSSITQELAGSNPAMGKCNVPASYFYPTIILPAAITSTLQHLQLH